MLDALARSWAEAQVRDRAEAYYPGARALARIRSPRFLRPLLRRGLVSELEVALFDADVKTDGAVVRLRRLVLHLREVRVARGALLRGCVRLRSLGTGRLEAEMDGPSLAAAVGLPLVFHEDEVEVRLGAGPFAVSARGALSVDDDVIRFRPGTVQGLPLLVSMDFELPVPTSPLWPRAAEARSVEGGLVLTCDLDAIPPGLLS